VAIRSNASACRGARAKPGQCPLLHVGPSAKPPPAQKPRDAWQPLCDVSGAGRGRGRPRLLPGPCLCRMSCSQTERPSWHCQGESCCQHRCAAEGSGRRGVQSRINTHSPAHGEGPRWALHAHGEHPAASCVRQQPKEITSTGH